MTRSTRLLATGVAVIATALVVLLLSMRNQPEPVVVADAAPAASDVTASAEEPAASTGGTVGALAEDTKRMPSPLEVPEGHEAVAVTSVYDAGVAALPAPGDTVNIYAVFQQGLPDDLGGPGDDADRVDTKGVVRAMSGVRVLGVSGVVAETGGGNVTLVLALEPDDAERAIYLASTEQVWFTLVAEDHEAVEGRGVTRDSVLED